jgi:phosphoglycolate phosphatase-like HAD superfamily hydrolase
MITAVLFDLDGTLADTALDICAAEQQSNIIKRKTV